MHPHSGYDTRPSYYLSSSSFVVHTTSTLCLSAPPPKLCPSRDSEIGLQVTLLIRKCLPLEPYSRPMPRALWWPWVGVSFLRARYSCTRCMKGTRGASTHIPGKGPDRKIEGGVLTLDLFIEPVEGLGPSQTSNSLQCFHIGFCCFIHCVHPTHPVPESAALNPGPWKLELDQRSIPARASPRSSRKKLSMPISRSCTQGFSRA